ncbi:sporulation integral membrane protein YtvI [Halobacillus halophilus]|uniref:sporulation integral membrane protein YtvI n=1 Tax=Halobacillus halophilus TaxID=1570 RepID=UPI001CD2D443|nr:sporulation integral membrane protein YtvI [Halobacillus halophilus]MCA1009913.1 sporulation integral membrane protein YtvI [Halobacillus halophilus]
MDNPFFHQFFRFLFVVTLMLSIIFLIIGVWKYLYPFLIAFLISGALQPFIQLLEKRLHFPRTLAVLSLLFLLTLLTASLLTLVIAELIKGIQRLALAAPINFGNLVNYSIDQITIWFTPILNKVEQVILKLSPEQQSSIFDYIDLIKVKAAATGVHLLETLFQSLLRGLTSLPSSITTMLILVLAIFFICKDWEVIIYSLNRIIPVHYLEKTRRFPMELKLSFQGIIRAQVILVAVSTVIIGLGLFIIQVPNALAITMAASVVDIIPYIGTGSIFIPWIFYQFITGQFQMTIGLSIIYMIVLIVRQTLEPKILANHFGVPPILLLAGMFLGFQIFGLYGMILSPIVIVFIRILYTTGIFNLTWNFIKGN